MNEENKKPILKPQDAPIEVLLFDPLSIGPARFLARHVSALFVTGIAFAVRSIGCIWLAIGEFKLAALAFFLGFVLDAIDGKIARQQGFQVEEHGWWDFTLDQVWVASFVVATTYAVSMHGWLSFLWPVAWFGFYFALIFCGGTRFRVLGQANIDWRQPRGISTRIAESNPSNWSTRFYLKVVALEEPFRQRRMIARPTSIESLVIVSVVGPLFDFPSWGWIVAIAVLVPEILATAIPGLLLAKDLDKRATNPGEKNS